jgi:hypothetical protein
MNIGDSNIGLKGESRKEELIIFDNIGLENSKKLTEIKTKLYLGNYKGKKLNFYTTFTRTGLSCSSNIDLELVGKNFNELEVYPSGRTKSYLGQYPTTRKGGSNISRMTLAYLLAYDHICNFKQVGHINGTPSKSLVRDLMSLTMPEVECNNEKSKWYGVSISAVIKEWGFIDDPNYLLYKRYFNAYVENQIRSMHMFKKETQRGQKVDSLKKVDTLAFR